MCLVPVRSGTAGLTLWFPAHPVWVRTAREAVRTALTTAVPANVELIETAVLLTSEVVANAVTASLNCLTPPPIAMNACWSPDGDLQVAVYDHGASTPELREEPPPDEAEHGRGLLLRKSFLTNGATALDASRSPTPAGSMA